AAAHNVGDRAPRGLVDDLFEVVAGIGERQLRGAPEVIGTQVIRGLGHSSSVRGAGKSYLNPGEILAQRGSPDASGLGPECSQRTAGYGSRGWCSWPSATRT